MVQLQKVKNIATQLSSHIRLLSVLLVILVAGLAFWWYFEPFPWLGAVMALIGGALTYFILSTSHLERYRRIFFASIFLLSLLSVIVIISDFGVTAFLGWVNEHIPSRQYYLPGQSQGVSNWTCTRQLPQIFFGRADFLAIPGVWIVKFPTTLAEFFVLMIPYALTAVIFGRGFCGWLCPFGGLTEMSSLNRNQPRDFKFTSSELITSNGTRFTVLKEWAKDTKYGVLLAVVLLAVTFSFPVVCIFCPALWLEVIPAFWVIISLFVVFALTLPLLTGRRWWCNVLCPMGALLTIADKISLFRVKINKEKCSKCMVCVRECRMYALLPDNIEKKGIPNGNCIRCGRCAEHCPEKAIDIYLLHTQKKAKPYFVTLAIITAIAWYSWFILILSSKVVALF